MHILERLAKTTDLNETVSIADATYNFEEGTWRGLNGLVTYDPSHIRASKKSDIETGEDQKGY